MYLHMIELRDGDKVKHFKPTLWYMKTNLRSIDCKVAYVLFLFCNKYYGIDGKFPVKSSLLKNR